MRKVVKTSDMPINFRLTLTRDYNLAPTMLGSGF